MQTTSRILVLASGLLGFIGVALGAFGAHALKDTLAARGSASTWQTAVLYQLVHAVALLALAAWGDGLPHARAIGVCWVVGVLFFSGSLYWLALGGPRFLGPVTPLGGLLFLIGWLFVAWTALQRTQS
ncbi:MAG TPA: DUF423 domain-containing protein [Lacunisphaera sp.]|nr:DUF423 domain-containing protein [Lacunisphaera sp.]